MNKRMLFGFAFLLLIVAVTALSDSQSTLSDSQITLSDSQRALSDYPLVLSNSQATNSALSNTQNALSDFQMKNIALSEAQIAHITNLVKEAGCQTNDWWQHNGACFRVLNANADCWVCFSCYGPLCGEPYMCGCGQYIC